MIVNSKFKLLKPDSNKKTQIRLFIYHKSLKPDGRFVMGTGLSIPPVCWNPKTQRPRKELMAALDKINDKEVSFFEKYLFYINEMLDKIELLSQKYFLECKIENRAPSKKDLKEFMSVIK